jgi:hypothetical protein
MTHEEVHLVRFVFIHINDCQQLPTMTKSYNIAFWFRNEPRLESSRLSTTHFLLLVSTPCVVDEITR